MANPTQMNDLPGLLRRRGLRTLAVACVLFCGSVTGVLHAQAPPVELELKTMSVGSFHALTAEIDGADERLAFEQFRDLMKEYGGRPKRSKPERTKVEQVIVSSIGGSDPLDVYADFSGRGSTVKVYVWINQRGEFIGEASAERDLDNARSLIQEYALRLRRAAIAEELAGEQKALEKVEKKLRNLERDLDGYERDITRARETIERAEANIVKNAAAQEETKRELEQQAEEVEAVREKLANVRG